MTRLISRYGRDLVIIHGGAPGVDNAFAAACKQFEIKSESHLADWKGLGNIAGPAQPGDGRIGRRLVHRGCIARLRPARGQRIACAKPSQQGLPST